MSTSQLQLPEKSGGKRRVSMIGALRNRGGSFVNPGVAPEELMEKIKASMQNVFVHGCPLLPIEELNEMVEAVIAVKTETVMIQEVNIILATELKIMAERLIRSVDVAADVFLARLNEIWTQYHGVILPFFQAIFLPLHERLHQQAAEAERRESRDLGPVPPLAIATPPSIAVPPQQPVPSLSTDSDDSDDERDRSESVRHSRKRLIAIPLSSERLTTHKIGLAAFRDFVLLSRGVKDQLGFALSAPQEKVPPRVQQMVGIVSRLGTQDRMERELLAIFQDYLRGCVPEAWRVALGDE